MSEKLFELIGEADEKYVGEALCAGKKSVFTRRAFLIPAAAIILLLLTGATIYRQVRLYFNGSDIPADMDVVKGAYIPEARDYEALGAHKGTDPFEGRAGYINGLRGLEGDHQIDGTSTAVINSLLNIKPLDFSRLSKTVDARIRFGDRYGSGEVSYDGTDTATGNFVTVDITYCLKSDFLPLMGGVMYMKEYTSHILPCGKEATISESLFTDEKTGETVPVCLVRFIHNNYDYFIYLWQGTDETIGFLDSMIIN